MKTALLIGIVAAVIGASCPIEEVKTIVGCFGLVTMFMSPIFSKDE